MRLLFKYLKGYHIGDNQGLFSIVPEYRTHVRDTTDRKADSNGILEKNFSTRTIPKWDNK